MLFKKNEESKKNSKENFNDFVIEFFDEQIIWQFPPFSSISFCRQEKWKKFLFVRISVCTNLFISSTDIKLYDFIVDHFHLAPKRSTMRVFPQFSFAFWPTHSSVAFLQNVDSILVTVSYPSNGWNPQFENFDSFFSSDSCLSPVSSTQLTSNSIGQL